MKRLKVCSFFVSKTHLLTIILPYINEKISEGKNVKIISQVDLNDDVKKYIKTVRMLDNENIKNICWRKKNEIDDINENTIVFYIGDENFIESKNNEKECEENIKCYEIKNVSSMEKILQKNEYYLKTKGKFRINKNSHNEQISNTIKAQL